MPGIEWFRETLKEEIARFDAESTKHKKLHRRCQTGLIALTAITTIVAGMSLILPESSGKAVQFAVICLTAITTAVAAWAEMRRARDLWQHEREVYYALIDIRRGMEFIAANRELTSKELEDLFTKIDAVLGSSSQKWARIQQKKNAETS
jgi:hypothetical protein